jgi:hypothetical protein
MEDFEVPQSVASAHWALLNVMNELYECKDEPSIVNKLLEIEASMETLCTLHPCCNGATEQEIHGLTLACHALVAATNKTSILLPHCPVAHNVVSLVSDLMELLEKNNILPSKRLKIA